MQLRIKYTLALLLTIVLVSCLPAVAQVAPAVETPHRAELALDYSFLRSNAPPGGCGCFNLNGGSATFAWPVKPGGIALATDLTIVNANNINNTPYGLGLGALTAGARYVPRMRHWPVQPFGQVLAGVAHSVGSPVRLPNPGAPNGTLAFAANAGGGLDLRVSPRVSLRLVEADYLVTTFNNGVNDHQNILRISAGLVLHFGKQ
jgi:peptidoglycan-associated lipoprotein